MTSLPSREVAPEFLAGVAEEGLRLLGHDGARASRGRVDLDDAVELVTALVVLERHGRAALAPLQPRHVVRVREQRRVDDDLLFRGDVEDDGPLDVQHVARLRVLHRRVLRLELILGRGFDEVDVAAVAGRHLVDGNLRRVGRPHQRVGIVVAAFRSVGAEQRDLALAGLADRDVVVVDERFELLVGRLLRLGAVDVEDRPDRPGEPAAASASAAPSGSRGRPAGVGLERAAPHRRSARPSGRGAAAGAAARASRRERELDRAVVVDEREGGERKRDGGVLSARRGREDDSQPRVIEGRLLRLASRR